MNGKSLQIAALLLACAVAGSASPQTRPEFCDLMRRFYSGPQKRAPESLRGMSIDNISAAEGFRIFSGYYCDWGSDFPTIYAHSGNRITVTGYGYEQEFDMRDLDKALDAWRALLAKQHYEVPPK